jgi:hypothetical protein
VTSLLGWPIYRRALRATAVACIAPGNCAPRPRAAHLWIPNRMTAWINSFPAIPEIHDASLALIDHAGNERPAHVESAVPVDCDRSRPILVANFFKTRNGRSRPLLTETSKAPTVLAEAATAAAADSDITVMSTVITFSPSACRGRVDACLPLIPQVTIVISCP